MIIAGFGLNGQNLSRVLKVAGIPYIILELNPDTIKNALREGECVLFGDISSQDILKAAGVERAKVIVFAISDRDCYCPRRKVFYEPLTGFRDRRGGYSYFGGQPSGYG